MTVAVVPTVLQMSPLLLQRLFNSDTGVAYFPFKEMRGLPFAHFPDGTKVAASTFDGKWTRKGNDLAGLGLTRSVGDFANFGSSTNFLPDPAAENQVTFDIICTFTQDFDGNGDALWDKGVALIDTGSFNIGRDNNGELFASVRVGSGGEDEEALAVTGTGVYNVLNKVTHIRMIVDTDETLGWCLGLYRDDMTTPIGTSVVAVPGIDGIENPASTDMTFGKVGATTSSSLIGEALCRKGVHTDRVL